MTDRGSECPGLRERLLVADPAELSGAGDSALARHLRECASCARAARRILHEQAELTSALSALAPVHTAFNRDAPGGAAPMRRTHPVRRALGVAAALATAAALVLVALQSDDTASLEPLPGPLHVATDVPIVNAAGNDAVAVVRTSNPNITVVWVLERERQR